MVPLKTPLNAKQVASVNEPGRYRVGQGLYLVVSPGLTKSWVLRITVGDKRKDYGLGSYEYVGLAQARQLAESYRIKLDDGQDPRVKERPREIPTFAVAARKKYEANFPGWRKHRHNAEWLKSLERHAFPKIGELPISEVSQQDVLSVLEPIWGVKTETARRVRQRIRATFAWAMAQGIPVANPAGEVIDAALPPMPTVQKHMRAVPYEDVAAALQVVEDSLASEASKLCLKFLVYTAARSGEARGAKWDEISLNRKEWKIPGHRMKRGIEHRVPLSAPARQLLNRAELLKDDTGLIFPSPSGRMLSDSTLSKLLRENQVPEVPHGFRSAFADWADEVAESDDVVSETCLAHVVGSSQRRAYKRSDLFERRRRLMEQWGTYLTPAEGSVEYTVARVD